MTTPLDHELDEHLRRTLVAVAATVHEDPAADTSPSPRRSRVRRRLLVGAGVTIAAIPLAAAAVVQFGHEYVDQIPPANPIISGSLDGERYWIVDGRNSPHCAGSPTGIELIAEENNIVGQEWNTAGAFFGGSSRDGCRTRRINVPPEYTYDEDGGMMVGDGMLWMGALHPEVDQVQVSLDRGNPFDATTFEHEGRTYYVQEVPPDTATFTIDYVVDGEALEPLPGERAEHTLSD
jgi:hypothetical protein